MISSDKRFSSRKKRRMKIWHFWKIMFSRIKIIFTRKFGLCWDRICKWFVEHVWCCCTCERKEWDIDGGENRTCLWVLGEMLTDGEEAVDWPLAAFYRRGLSSTALTFIYLLWKVFYIGVLSLVVEMWWWCHHSPMSTLLQPQLGDELVASLLHSLLPALNKDEHHSCILYILILIQHVSNQLKGLV